VGGQCHAPAALPRGKSPGSHRTGGWVGPRAGVEGCATDPEFEEAFPLRVKRVQSDVLMAINAMTAMY
jgi:hypothetical protein